MCGSEASAGVAGQIRQWLADGHLKPGDFLGTESSLSREFGVRRGTLRDALRVLEADGIVRVMAGQSGGVRVAEPNPQTAADVLAVQLMLAGITEKEVLVAQMGVEMSAAELAAEKANAEDIAALEAQHQRCSATVDDQEDFARESLRFHLELIKASHNRALLAHFHALRHVLANAFMCSHRPDCIERALDRHSKTLAAVRARDPAAAAMGVREHFRHVIDAPAATNFSSPKTRASQSNPYKII